MLRNHLSKAKFLVLKCIFQQPASERDTIEVYIGAKLRGYEVNLALKTSSRLPSFSAEIRESTNLGAIEADFLLENHT